MYIFQSFVDSSLSQPLLNLYNDRNLAWNASRFDFTLKQFWNSCNISPVSSCKTASAFSSPATRRYCSWLENRFPTSNFPGFSANVSRTVLAISLCRFGIVCGMVNGSVEWMMNLSTDSGAIARSGLSNGDSRMLNTVGIILLCILYWIR